MHQITDTNSRNSIDAHHKVMRLLPLCCAAVAASKAQDRWCPPPKLPPRTNQNISIITEFHSKVTPSDNFNLRAHNTGGVKTLGFRYTATALARFASWHLVVARFSDVHVVVARLHAATADGGLRAVAERFDAQLLLADGDESDED